MFYILKDHVHLQAEKLREKLARKYCLNTHDQNKHCSSSTICTRSGRATGTTLTEMMDKLPVCRQRSGHPTLILVILHSIQHCCSMQCCTLSEFRTNSQESYMYSDETQQSCQQMRKTLVPIPHHGQSLNWVYPCQQLAMDISSPLPQPHTGIPTTIQMLRKETLLGRLNKLRL